MSQRLQGNLQRMKIWNQWKFLQNFLLSDPHSPMRSRRETCCKTVRQKIRTTSRRSEVVQTVLWCQVWEIVGKWDNSSLHLKEGGPDEMKNTMSGECTLSRIEPAISTEMMDSRKYEDRSGSWTWRSAFIKNVMELKSWSNLYFETKRVSWVRTVNGIDKYVTETSETDDPWTSLEHKDVTVKTCCEGQVTTEASCDILSLSPSLFVTEHGWTSKRRTIPIKSALQYQKSWSHNCDMLHQFLGKMMEQSYLMTSMEEFKKKKFDDYFAMASSWLDNLTWQKEEDTRKGFNTAWILTLPNTSCICRAIQGHSGGNLVWSYVARQCTVAGWLYRVHLSHRKCMWNIFNNQKRIDPRREKSQKG